jgi:endoglucanase
MGAMSRVAAGIAAATAAAAAAAAAALGVAAAPVAGAPKRVSAPPEAAAFIRVDQLGYPSSAPKRAYLMSRAPEGGRSFTVRDSGGAVRYTGFLGAPLGAWSRRFPYVYALDFDALEARGTYTVTVEGAASPPFQIAAPATLLGPALHNTLSFYRDERDGPGFIPSPLRTAAGHLNDASAETYASPPVNAEGEFKGELKGLGHTIDASGGWWDAGDYLKFVQTTSYTVAMQLVGARDFPQQMGASASGSDFTGEARFGLEWLLRMWDERARTLYYQVGIGAGNSQTASDHDIWRLPQADDSFGGSDPRYRFIRHRPVFRAAAPGSPVSPNLAGRDAAAFALGYQVFRASDPAFAARCLHAAQDIFALADTSPRGHLVTALPFGFYPESEWRDDLELGATELAVALQASGAAPGKASFYLQQAAHWAREYIAHRGRTGDPLNLYDVSGLAHFELVRALRAAPAAKGLEVGEEQLVGNLRAQLEADTALARRDPFGFGFPWNTSDTASHAGGLSVMASEYSYLTGDASYRTFAVRWLGNLLGANAWGESLVIGDGSSFPDCPQHQVANIVGSLDGSPPVLAGAVVEGPNAAPSTGALEHMRRCPPGGGDAFAQFDNAAVFRDNVQSFTTVEPAIDLTASSPLAFSWQVSAPAALPG